jgi:hypothetical protein
MKLFAMFNAIDQIISGFIIKEVKKRPLQLAKALVVFINLK